MRIISLNGNGIRACVNNGMVRWWESTDADLLLFQEVRFNDAKAIDDLFPGHWTSLFPSKRKGYSGVLAVAKKPPSRVVFGMGEEKWDDEGRVMKIEYPGYSVVNAYFPSGASRSCRQDYKLKFLKAFRDYIDEISLKYDNLIVAADWNMCHNEIDIHNPKRLSGLPGFTSTERSWLDALKGIGWKDAFRMFNDLPGNYTWWSYQSRSRERNIGWRIDGFWVSPSASIGVKSCVHLSKAKLSDHCPVLLEWELPITFT
ncbi:MAG: Exodeoxyribonuclease [Owenweeksia sp. TMED14]|nr:MAG: Exodeoxyribonuclease [Owenweeksia sp. TMED14]|tara:strand:+ start:249 stop:1022 length:774 start_codon:yes stop_codon:yes gene_type:complete